jgi:hypothetical protein
MSLSEPLLNIGKALEERFVRDLGAKPDPEFSALLDLKNLAGDSTGYTRVFRGDRLAKASSLSITMGPVGRYFNIHIIPDHRFDIPRFVFEGMVMANGSQVTMDLFPDADFAANFDDLSKQYSTVAKLYDEARNDSVLNPQPSRQAHIRAFCSPFILLVFGAPEEQISLLEDFADRYFSAWLDMFRNARELDSDAAAARLERRELMARTLMAHDPDRPMVVQIYGEETTHAIERATML